MLGIQVSPDGTAAYLGVVGPGEASRLLAVDATTGEVRAEYEFDDQELGRTVPIGPGEIDAVQLTDVGAHSGAGAIASTEVARFPESDLIQALAVDPAGGSTSPGRTSASIAPTRRSSRLTCAAGTWPSR